MSANQPGGSAQGGPPLFTQLDTVTTFRTKTEIKEALETLRAVQC